MVSDRGPQNTELGQFLHFCVYSRQYYWSEYRPWNEYVQNSLVRDLDIPFQCVAVFQSAMFLHGTPLTRIPAVDNWF